MRKLLVAILTLMAVTTDLWAGTPPWNPGYVILPDGRKLEGQLNYNWKAEVVQVRLPDGLVKAYSAGYVDSFAYFDNAQQLIRQFSTVDLPVSDEELRPVFLEELAKGSLTVYRRLRHAHELIKIARPMMYSDDSELVKDMDNFVYVVIDREGQVFDLASFNKTLWPKMSTYQQQLTQYLRGLLMDTSSTTARLMLINQYNYLSLKQNTFADTRTGE